MTYNLRSQYYPLIMKGWQYNAAFVIQFRPETDIEAGRFEGKVEHIPADVAGLIKVRFDWDDPQTSIPPLLGAAELP